MAKLLWKEWHEQSWKLAFGCVVLAAIACIGLRARLVADQRLSLWICFLGLTLLPVLSSTGLVPAERSEGSFESLLSLPVRPWKILLAKTQMGLLLCAGPMICAALVSAQMAGGREMSSGSIVMLYLRSTLTVLSLFVWMLALTIRLPSEARAGLLGLGLLIFWMLATAGLSYPDVPQVVRAVSPFAFVYGVNSGFAGSPHLAMTLLVQALALSLLWRWTLSQLNNSAED